jgi:cellulose synthase/poly-beta-1,6-N-acetylglucosamine synthase-like glycosyltransferase
MAGLEGIDFVDTYSAAYRRDVFLANHGFDTFFPTASVEDQELSFRLTEKGCRLVFVPQAQVYHRHNPTLRAYVRRKFFIGYWKALLARWYPGRMVQDSHTPQVLKVQMGLAALTLSGLLVALLASLLGGSAFAYAAFAAAVAAVAAFVITEIPFLTKAWRRDRGVLLPAVGLLWVRALALGCGFALGLVRFSGRAGTRRPPFSGPSGLSNGRTRPVANN